MRLDPKSLPAKFRPNPLTFRANVTRKTDERRRTPQQLKGRGLRPLQGRGLRPLIGGFAPLPHKGRGSLRDPPLRPNRPEKGNHLASLGG